MKISDTFVKFKDDKKYLMDFFLTTIFLLAMVSTFYFSVAMSGRPNLVLFIIVVLICFSIITLFLARHLLIGLVMMIIGGLFGFFTDFWGTGTQVFLYREDIITFTWLLRGITTGVPIEIVASYFFASMWLMQIIESIFDQEIEELIQEYDDGKKLINNYKQFIPFLIVIVIFIIMVTIKPILIQPWGYFSIGVFLTTLVPGNKKIIPIIFGGVVGFVGLFFELFCTGEIVPEAVIWTYSNPDWGSDITYRAIIAYSGVGASLASIFLILIKYPIFRKEFSIISISN